MLLDEKTKYLINTSGSFIDGGSFEDSKRITGGKIVDIFVIGVLKEDKIKDVISKNFNSEVRIIL